MPGVTNTQESTKEVSLSLRDAPYAYIHISVANSSRASSSLDEITIRQHLLAALKQYLGLHGTAIEIDILKISGLQAWLRMQRDDEMAVVASLSQYSGNSNHDFIRVLDRSSWLGTLTNSANSGNLWTLES